MKISILALGSNGDITPCAALGGALAKRGHSVRLASHADFAGLAQENGLAFTAVAPSSREMVARAGIRLERMIAQYVELAERIGEGFSAPEVRDADLILNQLPGGLYGMDLAEKVGVPMLALAYLPILATGAFPSIGWPRLPWKTYNRFTYVIAEMLVWSMFRAPINRWRKGSLGLPPKPPNGRFRELGSDRFPWLAGFSPHLIPPPPDWGEHIYITGYWHQPEDGWRPSASLLRFFESGPPPVCIGFGSMAVPDPAAATRVVLTSLQRSGLRAVLIAGWGGLGETGLPESVFAAQFIPYTWLFPRCAGAVIHGGVGAVHCAARAGIPILVVPFLYDQFFWGRRLHELGAGPAPLPFKRLTAQRLAMRLDELPAFAGAATALGQNVRHENGISAAMRIIERIASGIPVSRSHETL